MLGCHRDLYDPGLRDFLDETATPGRNSTVMHPTLTVNMEEKRIPPHAVEAREQEMATDYCVQKE